MSICPSKHGMLGQKNLNCIKDQLNLLINAFEQHLVNGIHVCSWMFKLCMKTLQCNTKVLFCFEEKNNSNVILKRDMIQHGNVKAVVEAACW